MRPSMTRSIWLLILAGSLLAGCTASASPPPASSGLLPAEGRTPAAGSAPTGTLAVADPFSTVTPQAEQSQQFLPALENQSAANPTQTQPAVESPTATPPSSRKEIKAGLEASDPNAAQLASGKVQLVEFFAFW